jgi:hypothetical protein
MAPHSESNEVSIPSNGKTNAQTYTIPTEMKAIRYNKVKDWSLVTMSVPKPRAHEILVKGRVLREELTKNLSLIF